jgi:hypothetical protein
MVFYAMNMLFMTKSELPPLPIDAHARHATIGAA